MTSERYDDCARMNSRICGQIIYGQIIYGQIIYGQIIYGQIIYGQIIYGQIIESLLSLNYYSECMKNVLPRSFSKNMYLPLSSPELKKYFPIFLVKEKKLSPSCIRKRYWPVPCVNEKQISLRKCECTGLLKGYTKKRFCAT